VNGPIVASAFLGDGSGLLGLNAGAIGSGILPSTALSGTYSNPLNFNNAANSFSGSGSGLTALNASQLSSGTVPNGAISGTYSSAVAFNNVANSFTGNGSGLGNVNAATLNGLSSASFWSTTGNAGTTPGANFIGTTDNKSLLIKGSFVGVNRTNSLVSTEVFGMDAPATAGNYGGMYINTTNATAKPFYGFSVGNGIAGAWTYLDGADANKWKLFNGGDRITVTSGGLVGIGTTAPDATLSVGAGTASKPAGGSWAVFSDVRLKKNIQPLKHALERLMDLRPVTFEYKDPESVHELPGTQIGMIAQEVEKVFPDWVDTAPNGMKRLSIHGFEALTVEALRELRVEKDEKISNLEKNAADLRKELVEARAELSAQKELLNKMASRFEALERTMGRTEAISSPEFAESENASQRK
jgi:hypothetical protein